MIRYFITRTLRHLSRPSRNITEIELDHPSAFLANDMVMVTVRLTEFVFDIGPPGNFEDNPQGFEKIEAPVDGGQANLSLFPAKRMKEFLRAERRRSRGELLIDQKPRMA